MQKFKGLEAEVKCQLIAVSSIRKLAVAEDARCSVSFKILLSLKSHLRSFEFTPLNRACVKSA